MNARVLASLALFAGALAVVGQIRTVYSVNTLAELAAHPAIPNETVAVLNVQGPTTFGPMLWYRHSPTSAQATNSSVIAAIPSGQWLAVSSPGGSGAFAGSLLCLDDSTAHLLSVAKVGTNYLLSLAQAASTTNGASESLTVLADDSTFHLLRARKVGTNYLLELTQ